MPVPGGPPRCPGAWAQGTHGPGGQGGEGGPGLQPNHWPALLRSHYNEDSGPGMVVTCQECLKAERVFANVV